MADLKLLKKVHHLPKLSLATRLKEYYDWEEHMEDFFWGRGLASALKMYYAEETMSKDISHWWDCWDKKFPCWTWSDMKAVLRRRFRSLESKKVATARAQNPQGTKANMRSSWADSIAGDEYLPAFNQPVGDINSYETKLGSGVSYGKSMHAEFVSSAKLKQATSHNNYGDKLSACARSSLGPKKKCGRKKKSIC